MKNPVQWFEIATTDLERAKAFYATVFNSKFEYIDMGDAKMYMFGGASNEHGTNGALIQSEGYNPSKDGTIVYFDCEDVANEASKVEAAGGKIIIPKMSIGEFGFIAQFIDTEGNRIGMHSNK